MPPSLWRLVRLRCDGRMAVFSGSMTSGNRGMGKEDGATSRDGGGPTSDNGDVTDESPPKFKSTGDVRRTLLVLLLVNSWPAGSLCINIRLPLLDRWVDLHGKSRFRNLDRFPPPSFFFN